MSRQLSTRRQRIARGETNHRHSSRLKLLEQWEREGFDVLAYRDALPQQVRDFGQQPPCDLVFVTSLSPQRIRRQKTCLRTWRHFGVQIRAVQATDEIEDLKPLFPDVQFVATDDLIERKVRIRRLAAEARELDRPVIVINSDLELYGPQIPFLEQWDQSGICLGYRWNYDTIADCEQEEWGIDAVKIEPAMVQHLDSEEICALGKPGWDWLLPALMVDRGFQHVAINAPQFFHQRHPTTWTPQSSGKTQGELAARYGITVDRMREVARLNRKGGQARVVV